MLACQRSNGGPKPSTAWPTPLASPLVVPSLQPHPSLRSPWGVGFCWCFRKTPFCTFQELSGRVLRLLGYPHRGHLQQDPVERHRQRHLHRGPGHEQRTPSRPYLVGHTFSLPLACLHLLSSSRSSIPPLPRLHLGGSPAHVSRLVLRVRAFAAAGHPTSMYAVSARFAVCCLVYAIRSPCSACCAVRSSATPAGVGFASEAMAARRGGVRRR